MVLMNGDGFGDIDDNDHTLLLGRDIHSSH